MRAERDRLEQEVVQLRQQKLERWQSSRQQLLSYVA
jgi:hypothetical protein